MKLKVRVGDLLEKVSEVGSTLDRKGTSGKMYIKAAKKTETEGSLYLYSTNMIAETLSKIPATIEEEGQVMIDSSKLQDGLSGVNKDEIVQLSLTPSGSTLKGQCGKTKFSLGASADVAEVANRIKALPLTEKPALKLPAGAIAEFVRRGMFCTAVDETGQHPTLAGIKLADGPDGPEAMATDNAIAVRVRIGKHTVGLGKGVILPQPSIGPLVTLLNRKKGEDAEIIMHKTATSTNKLFFKFGDTFYGTLTLAGAFPDLRPVVDNCTAKYNFAVNREALRAALSRASAFSNYKRSVEIELKDDELVIKARGESANEGDLSDSVEVVHTGDKPAEPVKMAIGIDYLINVASCIKSELLRIGVTKHDKPMIVSDLDGEDEEQVDTKYVLMGVSMGKAA